MIIPDVNLLVYAYNSSSFHHLKARSWFEDLIHRQVTIFLPWIISLSFMRLMTHRSVLSAPMDSVDCFNIINSWYELENVQQADLGIKGLENFKKFTIDIKPAGNLFYDTFLASLAKELNAVIHSNDADFSRFQGIRFLNPLK